MPLALLLLAGASGLLLAQQPDEDFRIDKDHPRLFLTERRLRLLRRERERQSPRWQQFEALMAGQARMPEPGFALAFFHQVSGDREAGRRAVRWALSPAADPRQAALVFDWCQAAMTEEQSRELAAKLEQGLDRLAGARDLAAVRSRVLAAVALAVERPSVAERHLRAGLNWWRAQLAPALKEGRAVVPRQDTLALFELLHAVRDNLNIDLREAAPKYFLQLPSALLLSYYPAVYPAAENEYRIPAFRGMGEPDLDRAARARAAEFAMVAYDTNALENQYVQGWLIHDRFVLRGALGVPYEFLWANPYQPGLSYYHSPLVLHDPLAGRLFARSSWDEDARWFGYFEGQMQVFDDGRVRVLNVGSAPRPIQVGETTIILARAPLRFDAALQPSGKFYIVGLKPHASYHVEVDDQEMRGARADAGGILPLALTPGAGGVRVTDAPVIPQNR